MERVDFPDDEVEFKKEYTWAFRGLKQDVLMPQNPLTQICYTFLFHCRMFLLGVTAARLTSVLKNQTDFISLHALARSELK